MTTVEDLMSYAREQRAEGRAEGIEQGMKKGIEKGKEEGKEERSNEIARSMKADGVPIETIAKYSGLSEAEIKSL